MYFVNLLVISYKVTKYLAILQIIRLLFLIIPYPELALLGLAQTMIKGTYVYSCTFCRRYHTCVATIRKKVVDAPSGEERIVTNHYRVTGLSDEDRWAIAPRCKNYSPNIRGCHDLIKKYGRHNFIVWERNNTKK